MERERESERTRELAWWCWCLSVVVPKSKIKEMSDSAVRSSVVRCM